MQSTNQSPLISVVIPAYNHERFIGPAIESVLNQTHQNFELIIVDDGSTDNTAAVISEYKDERITYVWQENQDAFNTINRGMGMASGDYISILNSDDIYTHDRLEKLLKFLTKNNLVCGISDVIPISDDGDVFEDPDFGWNQWHKKNRDHFFKTGDIYAGFLQGNFMVTTSNLFMTHSAYKKVGGFSSLRYLHDYDYIFRMMLAHPDQVGYLHDECLMYYRIHSGNTLSEAAITGREQDLMVIKKYMLERIPEEYRVYVETGSDRLRSLENELHEVRAQLSNQGTSPTPQPSRLRVLGSRIKRKILS